MSGLIFPTLAGLAPEVKRSRVDGSFIQTASSGRELRGSRADRPRWKYGIKFNILRSAAAFKELQALESFIGRLDGRTDSFLWKDAEDYSVTAHGFGVGDGSTKDFQLQRTRGGNFSDVSGTWPAYDQPRTNLLTYSQDYSNAAWSKNAVTQGNAAVWAPDGSLTADVITDTSANSQHGIVGTAITVSAATVVTLSMWLRKAQTYDTVEFGHNATAYVAVFNLATGVVASSGASCTGAITSGWNGWYLCSVTFTTPGTSVTPALLLNGGASYVGGSGSVNVWNAQLELGSAATKPILTTSAAVTAVPAYWPAITDAFEPVTEPVPGIQVYSAGALKAPSTDYTLAAGTGVVSFGSAPASGAALTWTGSYWKRVRIDTAEVDFERVVEQIWELGTLDLISVI